MELACFLLELLLAFAFSFDHVATPGPEGLLLPNNSDHMGGGGGDNSSGVCRLRQNNNYDVPLTFMDIYTDGYCIQSDKEWDFIKPWQIGGPVIKNPWISLSASIIIRSAGIDGPSSTLCYANRSNLSWISNAARRNGTRKRKRVKYRYGDFISVGRHRNGTRKRKRVKYTKAASPPPPQPSFFGDHDESLAMKISIIPLLALVAALYATLISSTLVCVIIWRKLRGVRVTKESNANNGGSCIEPKLRHLTFSEVMSIIGERKILGGGGFGHVYLGCINGVKVAVKVLKASPEQETEDFQSEVKILATVHHKNLIRIVGYCDEGINRAIIFELMENGNLKNHLSERNPNVLSWELRLAATIGAAEGLEYLHHGCDPPIIHRDIKPENILLANDFTAKLADFGLSRIYPVQTSRVIGTLGYLDPEYKEPCMLTEKIDIYSFGVVMLVVITGQPAIIQQTTHITQWIAPKIRNRDIEGIVDPRLRGTYDVDMAWKAVDLAMACVSTNASTRPDMHYVVRELKECVPKTLHTQQQGDDNTTFSNEITVVH